MALWGNTVYFIDIDETLFHQESGKVKVFDWNNKLVDELDSETFNTYKLPAGYHYCHDDFRSSEKFIASATPIDCTINKLKQIIDENKNLEVPDLILILTARGDFDNKATVLDFFEAKGVPIKKYKFVEFIRTGNVSDSTFTTAQKKQAIVLSALILNRFRRFVMWDDSISNLEKFYEIKLSAHSKVDFSFIHVIHDRKDGKYFNYRMVEVKDEDAIKYIDVYRAKRVLARYGIDFYHPDTAKVDVAKDDQNKPKEQTSKSLEKTDEKIEKEENNDLKEEKKEE